LKVLEIRKKYYGEDRKEYAIVLKALCNSLLKLGEFEKAKEGYLKEIEIKNKYSGEDTIDYTISLYNLSTLL
jgi:hypothetical protein